MAIVAVLGYTKTIFLSSKRRQLQKRTYNYAINVLSSVSVACSLYAFWRVSHTRRTQPDILVWCHEENWCKFSPCVATPAGVVNTMVLTSIARCCLPCNVFDVVSLNTRMRLKSALICVITRPKAWLQSPPSPRFSLALLLVMHYNANCARFSTRRRGAEHSAIRGPCWLVGAVNLNLQGNTFESQQAQRKKNKDHLL